MEGSSSPPWVGVSRARDDTNIRSLCFECGEDDVPRGHLQDGAEPRARRRACAVSLDDQPLPGLHARLPLLLRARLPQLPRPGRGGGLLHQDRDQDEPRRGAPARARLAEVDGRADRHGNRDRPVPAVRGSLPADARRARDAHRRAQPALDADQVDARHAGLRSLHAPRRGRRREPRDERRHAGRGRAPRRRARNAAGAQAPRDPRALRRRGHPHGRARRSDPPGPHRRRRAPGGDARRGRRGRRRLGGRDPAAHPAGDPRALRSVGARDVSAARRPLPPALRAARVRAAGLHGGAQRALRRAARQVRPRQRVARSSRDAHRRTSWRSPSRASARTRGTPRGARSARRRRGR